MMKNILEMDKSCFTGRIWPATRTVHLQLIIPNDRVLGSKWASKSNQTNCFLNMPLIISEIIVSETSQQYLKEKKKRDMSLTNRAGSLLLT